MSGIVKGEELMSHIVPIGGSKGGTGKSFVSANLGISLAKRGKKTLLIDLDLGAANLHTMVGLPLPLRSLSDFINRRVASIESVVIKTSISNLFMISGARNDLDIANMPFAQKMKVLRAIESLNYDYVILDLGAGTAYNSIDFFMISDSGIFIALPEPTSIENIYRLTRTLCFRAIRRILGVNGYREAVHILRTRDPGGDRDQLESFMEIMRERNQGEERIYREYFETTQFKLVINQMRERDDSSLGEYICRIIRRHLGMKIGFLGNIAFDNRVHDSVCDRAVFVDKYPYTQTTTDIRKLSQTLLALNEADDASQMEVDGRKQTADRKP